MKDALGKELEQLAKQQGLGATGEFPYGRIDAHDEGELRAAVHGDVEREIVVMNFGKSVSFVAMTPVQAVEIAEVLIKMARKVTSAPLVVKIPQ